MAKHLYFVIFLSIWLGLCHGAALHIPIRSEVSSTPGLSPRAPRPANNKDTHPRAAVSEGGWTKPQTRDSQNYGLPSSFRQRDTCQASSWHGSVPDGKYPPSTKLLDRVMYATLINAGPDDFTLVSKHAYQMDSFDFQTVPALTARQNKMAYQYDVFGASGDFVDDKGEAHYQIEGSGNTFQVWARTHASDDDHPMRADISFDGFGTRDVQRGNRYEYKDRGAYRAINLVVTGSQRYGYWTSIDPPINWMCSIRDIIGDRKLKHVCLLGSHDAGMSTLNGQTELVNAGNTETQEWNIGVQLNIGSRYFDVRPVIGNGGHYLTGHYSVPSNPVLGGNGESLQSIVSEVNSFTANNAELVILYLSHDLNTDDHYRPLNASEWNHVFDIFQGLTHRCGGFSGDLTEHTINDYIGSGNACVLVIFEDTKSTPEARPDQGIYSGATSFPQSGYWSNTDTLSRMAEGQLQHLKDNRNLAPGGNDKFYIMQWLLTFQVTLKDIVAESIADLAISWAYDVLFWKAWNAFTPTSYPSVILMDYVGLVQLDSSDMLQASNELRAFAMAVNLAVASKNCYVGGGTIY